MPFSSSTNREPFSMEPTASATSRGTIASPQTTEPAWMTDPHSGRPEEGQSTLSAAAHSAGPHVQSAKSNSESGTSSSDTRQLPRLVISPPSARTSSVEKDPGEALGASFDLRFSNDRLGATGHKNGSEKTDDTTDDGAALADDPAHLRDLAKNLLLQNDAPPMHGTPNGSPFLLMNSLRAGSDVLGPWRSVGGAGSTVNLDPVGSPGTARNRTLGFGNLLDSVGSAALGGCDALDVPSDVDCPKPHERVDTAPVGVRHIVCQTTDRGGKPCFEQRVVLARRNDVVSFQWYDPASRVFETDASYNRVLLDGRHSSTAALSTPSYPVSPAHFSQSDHDHGMMFSPEREEAERGADDHVVQSPNATGARTEVVRSHCKFEVHFTEAGTYYFVCTLNARTMRVRVLVEDRSTSNARHCVLALFLLLLCAAVVVIVVLVLAFWLRRKDLFLSEEDASSEGQYRAIRKLQNVITVYLFPWLATGVMIFVVLLFATVGYAIYRCIRHRDPRREAQSRGCSPVALKVTMWVSVFLCLAITALLFVTYGVQLKVTNGLNRFAEQLGTSLQVTVRNYSKALDQVNWLVNESQTMFPDVDLPRDSIESITNNIIDILNKSSQWVVVGEDVIQGAFRVLPILLFLTLQIGLYVSALTIGSLALRHRRTAVMVLWLVVCSVAVVACACGVVWALSKLLGLIYSSAVVIGTSPETATAQFGIAPDSFISELFSYCRITPTGATDIADYVYDLVAKVNESMTCTQQEQFASTAASIEQWTPLMIDAIVNYSTYVESNLNSLRYIVQENPDGVNAFFNRSVTSFLATAVDVVSTAYGLVNCNVLKELIGDSIPILQRNVEGNNTALFVVLLIVFGLTITQMVCSALFVYFLGHPRKRWFEARTGRWFRLRYSYVVHRRMLLAEKNNDDVTASKTGWLLAWRRRAQPIMFRLLNARVVMYASSTLVFLDCILLVLFNNLARTITDAPIITAISYLGCVQLMFILGSSLFRQHCMHLLLLLCSLLVVVAVLVLSVVQLFLGYIHFGNCLHEARYASLISRLAHGETITNLPQYESCPIAYVGHELEVAVYASVLFLTCISLIISLVYVGLHDRFLTTLFQRRPYTGFLLPLAGCGCFFQRLFKDHLYVRRVYLGFFIFVLVVFLVLFAVLNGSKNFQLVRSEPYRVTAEDLLQVIDPTVACNGDPAFCHLRVNQLMWACTHNSHSNMEDHFLVGNHYFNISRQLESGIRSFMIDLWYDKTDPNVSDVEEVYLCHSVCVTGRRLFKTVAEGYKAFLDKYPGQIIMLILQQAVNTTDIVRVMDEVGLTSYVWYSDQPAPNLNPNYVWPTLQEMIDKGQRLMMFNDAKANSEMSIDKPEWMYYAYNFQYENDYQTDNVTMWRCGVGRGWCNADEDLYAEDNAARKRKPNTTSRCPVTTTTPDPSAPTTTTTSSTAPAPTTEPTYSPQETLNALGDFTNCSHEPGPWVNGSDIYNAVMGHQPLLVGNKLSTVNHMIDHGIGSPMEASKANLPASVRYNTYRCAATWNQIVNILAHDYWNIDYPLAEIHKMNQNIATYGKQLDYKDNWKLLLFGDTNADIEPAPGEIPMS